MEKQNIRIKLRAYDNKILDASTEEIVNTVKRNLALLLNGIHSLTQPALSHSQIPGLHRLDTVFRFRVIRTQHHTGHIVDKLPALSSRVIEREVRCR